jgi:hypothetical protein
MSRAADFDLTSVTSRLVGIYRSIAAPIAVPAPAPSLPVLDVPLLSPEPVAEAAAGVAS